VNWQSLYLPLGLAGAHGAVAAKPVEEGHRVDREIATWLRMVEVLQYVRVQRQQLDLVVTTHALWTHLGPVGAPGAPAAKPVEEGHKVEHESATWPKMGEVRQSAQALRLYLENATPITAQVAKEPT